MSGSGWVTTPLSLSGSLRPFLYSCSEYFCHLFLISSASVSSLLFLPFIVPTLIWNVPLISPVSWRDLWSFPFYCFPLFLCIIHLKRLSYLSLLFSGSSHSFGYIFPFLPCLSLLFFPQLFVKPTQTTISPFCTSFSLRWFWSLPPVQCYKPQFIVLQTLRLSDLIFWIYSSPPLHIIRDLI